MANRYATEVQWGGDAAPWHDNGIFVIGGRDPQRAVGLWATSDDDGKTLTGEMQYGKSEAWPNGEGRLGFRATNIGGNRYRTEVQWGGSSAPWHPNGDFVLGGRGDQRLVGIAVSSSDNGEAFTGTMRYGKSTTWPNGEGEIGFRSRRIADVPVYRLFLGRSGDHLFTSDKAEADLRKSEGWTDEGIAFTLYAEAGPARLPLHRLFNPSGACHTVTSDDDEAAKLAASGWVREGTLGHVDTRGGVEIFALYLEKGGAIIDVVATTNAGERDKLVASGWELRPSPGHGLP